MYYNNQCAISQASRTVYVMMQRGYVDGEVNIVVTMRALGL